MGLIFCESEDCIHRAKKPYSKYIKQNGKPVFRCKKDAISIKKPFDADGDIERVAGTFYECGSYTQIQPPAAGGEDK